MKNNNLTSKQIKEKYGFKSISDKEKMKKLNEECRKAVLIIKEDKDNEQED